MLRKRSQGKLDLIFKTWIYASIEFFFIITIKIYPVWLCPFRLPANPGMLRPQDDREQMYVDIGTYGVPKVANFHPIETTRRVEEFVRRVKGFQMLYADSYMTEDEFHLMFDHSLYNRMRKELDCDRAFPRVYGKVNRKVRD